ncbi:MAG TPA: helix-turn-helix domain-containing protein [Sphingobium sp.]
MSKQSIPSFYLYGEPHRLVDQDFVHVEALDDRSRPSEWTIKPHSHAELTHLFALISGGGAMRADGNAVQFSAPCFLLVPAATVHGFEWLEETDGYVVTMANSYVLELARHDAELDLLFQQPGAIALGPEEGPRVDRLIHDLMRELSWSAPGHRAAVNAAMLSLLVTGLRHLSVSAQSSPRAGTHASIVARLRERIERRFRLREPVSVHAIALGVSQTALRVACARIAGRSPGAMIDQRALLEARRSLLYSNLSVAEIAFSIGFADPAYFSRFFQRNMGVSPRQYRDGQRTA